MENQKKFITKIINSFTPNMPLKVKEFTFTEDFHIAFVTMYYGHKIPNWKRELIIEVQEKVTQYTQVPTFLCINKKDFDKILLKYGEKPKKTDEEDFL